MNPHREFLRRVSSGLRNRSVHRTLVWLLGGWLLAPLFGTGTINQNDFSLGSLVVSLLGAVILLAIVNLFRRVTPR